MERIRFRNVLLAAGEGRRMGGRCKALLTWRDVPFLDHCLRALMRPGDPPPLVVVGRDAELLRERFAGRTDLEWVPNPRWRDGQTGSLQCALRRLVPSQDPADVTVIHLVDLPALGAATVDRLRAAWIDGATGVEILRPVHEGRPGHPVLVASSVVPALLSLAPDRPVRSLLASHPGLRLVPVDDPGVGLDVDTEGALGILRGDGEDSKPGPSEMYDGDGAAPERGEGGGEA